MVIRPTTPHGYSFVSPLKTTARRRMTPTSVAVLTAVAAAHLGLALYLYGQHFAPTRLPAVPEPAPIIIDIPRPVPKPPPTTVHRLQPRQLPVQVRDRVTVQTDQKIEVQRPQKTPPLIDTDKAAILPTEAGGDAAEPPPQRQHVISNPHWLRQPTGDDFADVYPQRALIAGKSGAVLIDCSVAASGDLVGCRVAEEAPPGWGFGAAALTLIKRFRLVPREEDGRPVGGAVVRIPIRFGFNN